MAKLKQNIRIHTTMTKAHIIDEQLFRLADDLVNSIVQACWLDPHDKPNLRHPTVHMNAAIATYEDYKKEIKG